jgi:hypothetical protein
LQGNGGGKTAIMLFSLPPMTSHSPDHDKEAGRVLQFRPRTPRRVHAFSNLAADQSPVPDIAKYGRPDQEGDDYRHRMKMNALAVLVLAVLIGGGMWIVDTMTQMRKNQDCLLSGRRNCVQMTIPNSH